MGIRLIVALLLTATLSACVQGHCRRKSSTTAEAIPVEGAAAGVTASPPKPGPDDRVFVYKYDGSLQCGMGKAIPLEVMAKQLTGIPVLSSAKKNDGMMHIQVCGSITGMANVYQIPAKHLKTAESKGFKKWSAE